MKKMLTMLLAVFMVAGAAMLPAAALNDEDYDNQDFFTIDESVDLLVPGQNYYFECDWSGDPITDDFFDYYSVSVSYGAPEGSSLTNAQAKKYVKTAQFVKGSGGKYYFLFCANNSYSYVEDVTVRVTVIAKDKRDSDYRSWYEMELDIGYEFNNSVDTVYDSPHEVDPSMPILEFDEDLDACRLEFDDGSYYNLRLSRVRKFNFGYTEQENQAIVSTNPGAELKFLSFYARPSFASDGLLKIYAPGAQYLYQINSDNTLTRVSSTNTNDYFGITTAQLGAYVASDRALKSAGIASQDPVDGSGSSTAPASQSPAPAPTSPVPVNPPTGCAA
jgi:hypothetical protein